MAGYGSRDTRFSTKTVDKSGVLQQAGFSVRLSDMTTSLAQHCHCQISLSPLFQDSLPYRPWDWLSGPGANDRLPCRVELPSKLRNARPAFQLLLHLLAGLRFKRGAAA